MPDPVVVAKPVLEDISARGTCVQFKKELRIGPWSGVWQCRNTDPDSSVTKTHLKIVSCRAITAGLLLVVSKGLVSAETFVPFDSIDTIDLEPQAEYDARITVETAAKKASK